MKKVKKVEAITEATNDAQDVIVSPYAVKVSVQGTAPFLFHRWSVEGIEAKAKAAKGSAAKKSDNVESYVYRTTAGDLAIPAEYFRMATVSAAKYRQDPRSPRKSAMDLFKAGIVPLNELCSLGTGDWDYLDRRRVMIQRNGITRIRPCMNAGWAVEFELQVLLPEYIGSAMLNETIQAAGRLTGVGDFRPTFGRFVVTRFQVM